MPALLTQNSKIKKSGEKHGVALYNFGIPAYESAEVQGPDGKPFKTCPAAGMCARGCYARQGAYVFSNVAPVFEWRLRVTLDAKLFDASMEEEIFAIKKKAKKRNMPVVIRIHDSGDFYNLTYYQQWEKIMLRHPDIRFYAYTKQVRMFRNVKTPPNFRLIFSEGGLFDKEIDRSRPHSRVFETLEALKEGGYADASKDDLVAGIGENPNIGLVYHGVPGKSWKTA